MFTVEIPVVLRSLCPLVAFVTLCAPRYQRSSDPQRFKRSAQTTPRQSGVRRVRYCASFDVRSQPRPSGVRSGVRAAVLTCGAVAALPRRFRGALHLEPSDVACGLWLPCLQGARVRPPLALCPTCRDLGHDAGPRAHRRPSRELERMGTLGDAA